MGDLTLHILNEIISFNTFLHGQGYQSDLRLFQYDIERVSITFDQICTKLKVHKELSRYKSEYDGEKPYTS